MATPKIEYHERWFLLILLVLVAFFYSALGSMPSGKISFDLQSFAINFFYSAIILLLLRFWIDFLDVRLPWTNGLSYRFGIQLASTLCLFLLVQTLILYIVEPSTGGRTPKGSLLINTYLLGTVFLIFANAIYLMRYIQFKEKHEQEEVDKPEESKKFLVGTNKGKRVSIPLDSLTYLYIDQSLTIAVNRDDDRILLQESLTELEPELDSNLFFRASRQFILTKEVIKDVSYLKNKTSEVTLFSDQKVIVSRYKTPQFKRWLR